LSTLFSKIKSAIQTVLYWVRHPLNLSNVCIWFLNNWWPFPSKWSLSPSSDFPDSPLHHPLFNINDLPSFSPVFSSHSSPVPGPSHSSPYPGPTHSFPGPFTEETSSVETGTASLSFKPEDAVNVLTQNRPWLAAIVEHNDGEYITYFHPHLKVTGVKAFPWKR